MTYEYKVKNKIVDRYELTNFIAEGSFGKVYLA
jgi:hypothetical protein